MSQCRESTDLSDSLQQPWLVEGPLWEGSGGPKWHIRWLCCAPKTRADWAEPMSSLHSAPQKYPKFVQTPWQLEKQGFL